MADEEAVLAANRAFYEAFAAGDGRALEALFAAEADLQVAHPWRPAERGADALQSWRGTLAAGAPDIVCHDAHAFVRGDLAVVTCLEQIEDQSLFATNVFVRETEGWRLCHHHASVLALGLMAEPAPGAVH